ncbi:MAG: magnesium protoporphyrin IX methyltransferase [Pseudomonadota bacterium]
MSDTSYQQRRGEIQVYFDRTALDAWKRFASDQPLSWVRRTVRAGREAMRAQILSRFPGDLSGWRILDAGCGAGSISADLARRGADVLGIDLSPEMIRFAQDQVGSEPWAKRITFKAGDMVARDHGTFDAVVGMDSVIHYKTADAIDALSELAGRTRRQIVFTVAPRTPLLAAMHSVGSLFPRKDRAPGIEPVAPKALCRSLASRPELTGWTVTPLERVSSGVYISQLLEARA